MAYQQPSANVYVTTPYVVQSGPDAGFVRDYLVWSIINLFCGWGILGFIPLICSIICRNNKSVNNYSGAQSWSTLALISNIIITVTGAIAWLTFIIVMAVIAAAASSITPLTTRWPPLAH